MEEELSIETERVDELPILFAQMEKMQVAALLDEHIPTHGNWQGLSLGQVVVGWLSHILSQGDHKLNHVEPWAEGQQTVLRSCLDEQARVLDWSDDRLARVLDYLGDDEQWDAFETALGHHLIRVYELEPKIVRLDSTTSSSYAQVTPDGLLQFGHSKDRRPDLPQLKVQLSTLDPLGLPSTSTIVSGEGADDPLYIPEIKKVQKMLQRHGLLYVGDCKMAAQATRAYLAASGDYYGCPLPNVQVDADGLKAFLQPVWSQDQGLVKIKRTSAEGEEVLIAEGFETKRKQEMKGEKGTQPYTWEERLLIVRSFKLAQAQEQGLRERLTKAQKEIEALNERGRGKRCFRAKEEVQEAVQVILKRHRVEGLLFCTYNEWVQERKVRRYREREAGVICEREARVEVAVDELALAEALRLLGWKVYATNAPPKQFPLDKVVLAYRNEYLIEHDFGRLKGATVSLRPMYLASNQRLKGLLGLLTIALRVLILLEYEVRQKLASEEGTLTGLYAGQAKRTTARPTAEKLLQAFEKLTLTRVVQGTQVVSHVTPLSPLQQRILALLGLPPNLYAVVIDASTRFASAR
jgi:transposase